MDDSRERFIVGTTGLEFLTLSMAGALNVKIVKANAVSRLPKLFRQSQALQPNKALN